MNTGVRIGLYAAGLAIAFGAAYGVGDRFGPEPSRPVPTGHGSDAHVDAQAAPLPPAP
ncbi:hypothetical protein [Streptomyces sp. BBFR102]|uniref:hypothetical protein n=1 Tax=Streptomyces sp. BBFR102 TaxID=3448171 RepID=UPI003F531EBD